jgi:hypothetical protein
VTPDDDVDDDEDDDDDDDGDDDDDADADDDGKSSLTRLGGGTSASPSRWRLIAVRSSVVPV